MGASTGRIRSPWLTYAWIGACAAAFFYAQHLERRVAAETEAGLEAAAAYLRSHPNLDVPRVLEGYVDADEHVAQRAQLAADRVRRGAPPIARGVTGRQLARLDDLILAARGPEVNRPAFLFGMRATDLEPHRFVTHAFVHSGWFHLLGSLLCLGVLGAFLERAWGPGVLLAVLSVGIVASAAAFAAGNDGRSDVFVGTSGAVAVLLGSFVFRYAPTWQRGSYAAICLTALAWLFLPGWLGSEWSVVRDFSVIHAADHLANARWAVAGGLLFGAIAAAAIRARRIEDTVVRVIARDEVAHEVESELDLALREHAAGHATDAFVLLSTLLERSPTDRDALLAMWTVASESRRPEEAARAMLQVIRGDLQSGASAQAVDHWFALVDQGLASRAEPALLLRIALMLREERHLDAARQALQWAFETADRDDSVLAGRVARAARDVDPEVAEDAAWRALGSVHLELAERQSLEALIAELRPRPGAAAERIEAASAGVDTPIPSAESPRATEALDPARDGEVSAFDARVDESEAEDTSTRLAPIDLDFGMRELVPVDAIPTEIADEGLVIETANDKKRVPYHRLQAVAVAAIEGLSARPIILVDLVLNWQGDGNEPLRVIRLRTDRFDPRRLVDSAATPLDAMRQFIEALLERSVAAPLPDRNAALGLPFASFSSLGSYHRSVLSVAEPDESG